jgi:hypothetical protein
MTTQQNILRACSHASRPCEVNLGTNRKPEVIFVCSDCWNTSVYAAQDERKAQLAKHWQQVREAQDAEMVAAGQKIGDRVSYFCASLLGIGGYLVTGKITRNRNGIAVIKFDSPQQGKHSGQWCKGWRLRP